ncbi:MAG: hypothetical protein ACYC64_15440 [Armatimonadota bacterium]
MRVFSRFSLIVLFVLIGIAAGAVSTPLVGRMLPVNGSVKGFSLVKDSYVYGKGNDITKIYDGGYELYTDHGVLDAARQMYSRKDDYVEVTIHTMASEKIALDFLKYWQKQNKVAKLTKTKTSTSFTVTKPSVMAYCVTGKYFTTISAFHTADRAKSDTAAFMAAIEKRIVSLAK